MEIIVYIGKIPTNRFEVIEWEEFCACKDRNTAMCIAATMAEHDGWHWYMYYAEDGKTKIKF